MNRRSFVWMGLALCTVLLSPVLGQNIPGIPKEAKQAADATSYKSAIDAFVQAQVARLSDKSATVQRDAREALSNESAPIGADPPAASFISIYAGSLDAALKALPADAPPRARLNAAIVAARTAARADNDQLKGAVDALLKDKNDAVSVWAMKAAKPLLPFYLKNPANVPPTLLTSIVQAVQSHRSAAVAQEAYDAASLGMPENAKNVTSEMLQQVIPEMQNLLATRIKRYQDTLPEEPQSDRAPTFFFSQSKVWQAHTPAQQVASFQLMNDLISVNAQRAVGAANDDRKQLVATLSATGRAMQVIGDNIGDPAIVAAAKLLSQSILQTTDAEISQRADALTTAINANATFKGKLQPAPKVNPLQHPTATTAPAPDVATAPATEPNEK